MKPLMDYPRSVWKEYIVEGILKDTDIKIQRSISAPNAEYAKQLAIQQYKELDGNIKVKIKSKQK